MTKRIYYVTAYDQNKSVCGYVMAKVRGEVAMITKRQYNNALKNRTIGGDAGLIFLTDKTILIDYNA